MTDQTEGRSRRFHSSHWGAFVAEATDGRVTAVEAFPGDPDPSDLLAGVAPSVHSDARVLAPAVRRSFLADGPGAAPELRGREPFVEVSWDTALDLVAVELDRVRSEHGNSAIFGGSYGWSSAGRFHHAKSQLTRFLNVLGGCTGQIHNYSYAAASAILPHVLGDDSATTGTVTSWDVIEEHTDLWLMFGGAPLRNTKVESGGVAEHTARAWLERIGASGTHAVLVSPQRDDAPGFLDAQWLPVRPNTDTALMLGLAHTLLVEDLHDRAFLRSHCVGWERFERYLRGDNDGTPKTAAWAEAICDIPSVEIERLARRLAEGRTMITSTWSLQRADHGEQPFWMVIALAAMVGQIGLPGGGFGFAYGNAAAIGRSRSPVGSPSLPMLTNPVGRDIPVARIVDMLLDPGGEYDFDGQRRRFPDTRLVYWAGGNPFHHHQDLNRLLEAWRRPETIVVHEPWWTATARHADVVLPATTTLERNDIGASSRDRHLVAMQQVIPPQGSARSDFDIFCGLADRLGVLGEFSEGRGETDWLRHLYGQVSQRAEAQGIELPGFDEFWDRGFVQVPGEEPTVPFADFRAGPDDAPLATPSGRIELYSETVASFGYDDCPPHPAWLEPSEWLGSTGVAEHPLHLLSNQPGSRLHGQLDMGPTSQASKIDGREPCRINPRDASERGIADRDVVRVFNDRGSCLAGAVLTEDIRPGVVQISTGAWYAPAEPGVIGTLDLHGNPNILTADRGTSRLGQGPSAHSALVQVERFDGQAPQPQVHEQPAVLAASGDAATTEQADEGSSDE